MKKENLQNEIAAYMNTEMKLSLEVDHMGTMLPKLIENTFNIPVFTGQKRVVVETGDEVMKLVYSPDGLTDNINDLLTSNRLRELAEGKNSKITEEELELFALSKPFNDDPYIIVAPKCNRLIESPEFNEWYKENKGTEEYKSETKNSMVGYFIMTNKKYNKQQDVITHIISKWFTGSDIYAFKVPENYAFNESRDLVLIDLGSILPKYSDVKNYCDSCGRDKKLMIPSANYKNLDDIDTLMRMKTGVYCCSNKNCINYSSNISSTERSNNLTDAVVFSEYQEDCEDSALYREDVANVANIFVPQVNIEDISEFRAELIQDTGYKFSLDAVKTIYCNSLAYLLAPVHSDFEDELDELEEDFIDDDYETSFDDFKSDVYEIILEDECDLFDLYAALLFIKFHINLGSEDEHSVNLFSVLQLSTKSTFISFMDEVDTIDEDDVDDLWDVFKIMAKKKKKSRYDEDENDD